MDDIYLIAVLNLMRNIQSKKETNIWVWRQVKYEEEALTFWIWRKKITIKDIQTETTQKGSKHVCGWDHMTSAGWWTGEVREGLMGKKQNKKKIKRSKLKMNQDSRFTIALLSAGAENFASIVAAREGRRESTVTMETSISLTHTTNPLRTH